MTDREVAEAAVRRVEAEYDDAWALGDLDALLACLAADAVVVNPRGELARGHDEIRRMLAAVLGGEAAGSSHASEIVGVDFVTDDVAVLDGRAVVDGPSAAIEHRFTDVLVRRDGAWVIAHVRAQPTLG